jgi:poly(A) RNA polymerase GLD2
MTGLGTNTSDVDMCLLVRHCEIDQKNEAITYLDDILKLLNRCGE